MSKRELELKLAEAEHRIEFLEEVIERLREQSDMLTQAFLEVTVGGVR